MGLVSRQGLVQPPQRAHREAIKEKSGQGAKRYLTVFFLKARQKGKALRSPSNYTILAIAAQGLRTEKEGSENSEPS